MLPRTLALVLGLASIGCGLVSGDVADTTLALPEKSYSFDTATLGLPAVVATLPPVTCAADSECVCPTGSDCTGVTLACKGGSCAGVKRVEVSATVDLGVEKPEFKDIRSQGIMKFSFKSLDYKVVSTVPTDLPPVDIYMAPANVKTASDPTAKKLGTIPATPARASFTSHAELVPTAGDIFTEYANDWATPFNFIAVLDLVLKTGQPLPTGRIDLTVWGYVTAKPAF